MADAEVLRATLAELQAFAARGGGTAGALALVETAGGPASPMPSSTLQVTMLESALLTMRAPSSLHHLCIIP